MRKVKPVLYEGSKGPAVRELQMLLKANLPSPRRLAIDGDFGGKTHRDTILAVLV